MSGVQSLRIHRLVGFSAAAVRLRSQNSCTLYHTAPSDKAKYQGEEQNQNQCCQPEVRIHYREEQHVAPPLQRSPFMKRLRGQRDSHLDVRARRSRLSAQPQSMCHANTVLRRVITAVLHLLLVLGEPHLRAQSQDARLVGTGLAETARKGQRKQRGPSGVNQGSHPSSSMSTASF